MTTPAQGKGKKKNKEKLTLDEFNQIDAPLGHSVVSVKMTGLDWAETMADYEQTAETHQIVVPGAPRAQRGPNVDYDSIPNDGPFRVSLYNLPVSAEEKDISDRFFQGLGVIRIDNSSKASTTVEFGTKQDLYEALCKDGSTFKGKTVNVCLYGEAPQNSYNDRYGGGRGGNSSYNDRYDRNQSGGFGTRMSDRYGDRPGGGAFKQDRGEGFSGFRSAGTGGGYGGMRGSGGGGFGDRFQQDRGNYRDNIRGSYTAGGGEPPNDEPENWRDRPTVKPPPPSASVDSYNNNGSRSSYMHQRSDPPHHHQAPIHHQQYQQPESYHQPRYNHYQSSNHSPQSFHNDRPGGGYNNNRQMPPAAPIEERPKLIVKPRKTPINVDDVSSVSRNEAIFGKAKPTAKPYQKMKEVEEKLSSVQIANKKTPSQGGSQSGSQPGSAPRSRQLSERSQRE